MDSKMKKITISEIQKYLKEQDIDGNKNRSKHLFFYKSFLQKNI